MTATETQYFTLLRAALWNTQPTLADHVDWEGVMRIAEHHGNAALLADVATRLTDANKPAPEMLAKMMTGMRSNLFNQMHLKQILVSAVKLLREHDIEPVLLKGFSLAMLYPNPNVRQFGDIDLFVRRDKFHEACRLLRSLPGSYNWGEETDIGRHYNIEFGQYPMEVHRVSADEIDSDEEGVYAPIEQEGLTDEARRVSWEGLEITVPSKEFMVFFTFFHAWHHFLTTGVGLRQLSDVAITLHSYYGQLDLDKLRRYLETMHVMEPWQAFGSLLVSRLGLPAGEMPFGATISPRRQRKLYECIMEEGNFRRRRRFKTNRPKQRLLQKMHAFICIFIDFFHLAKTFPKQAFRGLRSEFRQAFRKNLHGSP